MSEDFPPIIPASPETTSRRPGPRLSVGWAGLIVLLTTLPLTGIMYLGSRLLNLPFTPFDLYDWPIRAGFAPWISLIGTLTNSQEALGGNISQSASVVQWVLSLGLFFLLALAIGLAFYTFILRRSRLPDLIDGLTIGAIFAAPMLFVSLTTSGSPLPALLKAIWLGALFLVWGITLSYAMGHLMEAPGDQPVEGVAETGIGRRQFLLQFGAGAAAITAISAVGATLSPDRDATRLQKTLPMASPDLLEAQQQLFGNFRRFAIVRSGTEATEESNVLALGAEYPDRNYVSIWLGGNSPIIVYENLETALVAYGTEEEGAGIYWLDT